jgi:two-component system, OmpR family, alkaline phosphatase synthesis response regulator PhoP
MDHTDTPANVLVVEDEADMARILEFNLSSLGHRVRLAGSGAEAATQVQALRPDLILLDLRLPDAFGIDILRGLRADAATAAVPVIVVSALGDEQTVVQALDLGADDYVTKPFRTRELLARVATALRRRPSAAEGEPKLAFGPITMDNASREVLVAGTPVELTRSEFDLLAYFVANAGRVLTRKLLCDQALGSGGAVLERTIDAHVRTIRRKLGTAGNCLVTVWGVGYRLVDAP